MILLIIEFRAFSVGATEVKKCHVCGTTRENSEKMFCKVDGAVYCIFCLDKSGKPDLPNHTQESIKRFWDRRDSDDSENIGVSS